MAYDDRKKGLYTLREKGQGEVNDKSSSLLLTYPCDEVMVLSEEFRENSVVRMFKEASGRSISKSSLIKALVVSWQLMASLRSIWLWYQLCLVEASIEK